MNLFGYIRAIIKYKMKLNEIINILLKALRKNGIGGIRNILFSYINLKKEPLIMSSVPLILQIEPTTFCNLECSMCINPVIDRNKRHMKYDEFKKIIDSLPLLRKISLVGAGEPLLNPELFNMISYAKSKDILIGFATNGMLLNDEVCEKIIDTRLDWVNISIDSTDQKQYEETRKGASFVLLSENIKRLVRSKGNNSLPEISLWFVVMKDNWKELPALISLAKDLGIKHVSAQLQHDWGNKDLKEAISSYLSPGFYADLRRILQEAQVVAKQKGIDFHYVNIPDISRRRSCKWPWKSCYITVEGFLTPCCIRGSNPNIVNFGNIFERPFCEIWNNSGYQIFREKLKSKVPPEVCIGCTSYFGKLF